MESYQELTFWIALNAIQSTRDKLDSMLTHSSAEELSMQIQEVFNKNIGAVAPPDLYKICIQQISTIIKSNEEIQEEFNRIYSTYLSLYSRGNEIKYSYKPISGDPTSSTNVGDLVECAKHHEHYKGLLLFKGMRCNICGAKLIKVELSSKKKGD